MRESRITPTRRRLLTGICGGGLALTAGCLTSFPSLGQQVEFGPVYDPAPDPPIYRDWVPEVVGGGEEKPTVIYTTPSNLGADTVGIPFTIGWTVITSRMDYVGVDLRSAAYAVSISGFPTEEQSDDSVTVVRVPVDRSAVHATLDRTSYEHAGEYENLELFTRETPDRTVAIGDEVLLGATGQGARSRIERTFDTWQGTEPRLVDADDEFRTVTDRVGASPFLHLGPSQPRRSDSSGDHPKAEWSTMEYRFDDEYSYVITTRVFPEGVEPSRRYLEEYIHQRTDGFEPYQVDIRTDGRYGVVAMQAPQETMVDSADRPAGFWEPHSTWDVDDDGERITLTHEAGDPIDASLLTVEIGLEYGSSEEAEQQFSDQFETVTPGDSLTVDLPERLEIDGLSIVGSVPNTENTWQLLRYSRD